MGSSGAGRLARRGEGWCAWLGGSAATARPRPRRAARRDAPVVAPAPPLRPSGPPAAPPASDHSLVAPGRDREAGRQGAWPAIRCIQLALAKAGTYALCSGMPSHRAGRFMVHPPALRPRTAAGISHRPHPDQRHATPRPHAWAVGAPSYAGRAVSLRHPPGWEAKRDARRNAIRCGC